jgi:hypothetical protein
MTKGYIGYLVDLLQSEDWIGVSDNVEIAKGKYHIPSNWQDTKKIIRRRWLKR